MRKREGQAERRKFWAELIARHKQSGKSVEAFCQENGVGSPLFYTWRRRLAEKSQPVRAAEVLGRTDRPSQAEWEERRSVLPGKRSGQSVVLYVEETARGKEPAGRLRAGGDSSPARETW